MKTIAVDAMGGDKAPGAVLDAVRQASRDMDAHLVLVGPEDDLKRQQGTGHSRISFANATQVIEVSEHPVQAFRTKKDSTINVGLSLVRHGKADVFVSAGSTGALLAGGLLTLGRIKGIDRPALTVVVPGITGRPLMILDVGANTDVRPRNLQEFAIMASIYAEKAMGIPSPRIGLLNIGTEQTKGSEAVKAAHSALLQMKLNFVGNIEARDLFDEVVDVVVCDGFVGNVLLKSVEGVARTIFRMIRQEITTDLRSRAGAFLVKPYLKRVALRMDYSEYGGAPLLGLAAPCVKCHGSSDSRAMYNGLRTALRFTESNVPELIRQALRDEESAR